MAQTMQRAMLILAVALTAWLAGCAPAPVSSEAEPSETWPSGRGLAADEFEIQAELLALPDDAFPTLTMETQAALLGHKPVEQAMLLDLKKNKDTRLMFRPRVRTRAGEPAVMDLAAAEPQQEPLVHLEMTARPLDDEGIELITKLRLREGKDKGDLSDTRTVRPQPGSYELFGPMRLGERRVWLFVALAQGTGPA